MVNKKRLEEEIRHDAQLLSEEYKINSSDAEQILFQLAKKRWYIPCSYENTELAKALKHLDPKEVLEFFKTENLEKLLASVFALDYLNLNIAPLYTLHELQSLTSDLINHMNENKDSLIDTGFPISIFKKSLWLDRHLNQLYPLNEKHPLYSDDYLNDLEDSFRLINQASDYLQLQGSDQSSIHDLGEYSLALEEKILENAKKNINKGNISSIHKTPQDVNEPHPAFSDADVDRVKNLRAKVFDIKIKVLEKLSIALSSNDRNRSHSIIIDDYYQMIKTHLSPDDITFLLDIDKRYSLITGNLFEHPPQFYSLWCYNAGLTDLLKVIGHYQKELEIGTMNEVKKILECLGTEMLPESYYEVLNNHDMKENLDKAILVFSVLEKQESLFWKNYINKVNDLVGKATIEQPVIDPFKALLDKFILNSSDTNLFLKAGDIWFISYNKENALINHSVGLNYIAWLLANPEESFPSSSMHELGDQPRKVRQKDILSKMAKEQISHYDDIVDSSYSYGNQPVIDDTAKKDIKNRTEELKDTIKYKKSQKEDTSEEETELALLKEYLKSSTGLLEKPRYFNSEDEKARKNVTNAISIAIKRIEEHCPKTAHHLKISIKKGNINSYSPEKIIDWTL